MRVRLNEVDGFINIFNEIRYLVLFDYSYCDKICDKVKYIISKKSSIRDGINHNFGTFRIGSYDSLPIEKILTFHNVIIHIKSVVKKIKMNTNIIYFS